MKKVLTCIFLWLTTFSLWAQYNPTNPPEPGADYLLTLHATPSGGGSFNIGTSTVQTGGKSIRLRANASSNFQFVAWTENGVIISQDAQFDYQMPERNVTLTAHFDYVPSNPTEPSAPDIPVYSKVYAVCVPAEGGSYSGVTSGDKYVQGNILSLSARTNNSFVFDYWKEDGEIISTSASFKYVVKTYDTHLEALFSYNPSSPSEPPLINPTYILYISVNPANSGSFSPKSGGSYQPGAAINLTANAKKGYNFLHWTENDSVISNSASFTYTMPNHNVALQAHFISADEYNPSNPAEPGAPTGERLKIYGLTQNALRGQTILYPVWLENSTPVMNMYIDLTFPDGFVVDTLNARLGSRVSNHWLEKIFVEGNTWRMRVRGQDVLTGNNGQVLEIPVAVPEDALMGSNYLVALTHGVVMRPDSSQVPVTVKSGNIYVRKLYEDELFASFSFDKYQTRVGFRNMSSGHIQSVFWDFGDGQTSTEYSPLHVYENPGSYTVKLTIHGESEEDIMETAIYLNEKSTWKAEGSFYMDTALVSARNFSNFEELVTTLLQATVKGNIVVNILSGLNVDYDLTDQNLAKLISLYDKVQQVGYTITFRQLGSGHPPVVRLGTASQHSPDAIQQFWETLDAVNWHNVETHLYGVWFDFVEWRTLRSQVVAQGDKTKVIDFSRIAPALTYQWEQTPISDVIFGGVERGIKQLPSMLLVNEGDGANILSYAVSGVQEGKEFFRFTHSITVAPALVGLFNDLIPSNHALLDVTSFNISWNRILNAKYDFYIWDSLNPPATQPALHNTEALQYASSGFCQFGHTYKWVVVATNEAQRVASDTMTFSIRQLPNLHVSSLHCTSAQAENKLTVSWDVRNDGIGHTGTQPWKDRVWLVMDVYAGTATLDQIPATLLAEVDNVKALAAGESYSKTIDVSLPKNIYGDVYIVVTADMYNVNDIEWSSIGGSVINPYQPSISGTGYRYLYAKTNPKYNLVYEEGESPSYSDNFFYTKLQLDMPFVPDLQVSNVVVEPLALSEYANSDGTADVMANITPTPLTFAGLADKKEWYSGKRVRVSATVFNRGSAAVTRSWRNGLWIANSADRSNADMILLTTRTSSYQSLEVDNSVNVIFYADMPYDWSGNTVFHVMADIDGNVGEFANTVNNWGHTEAVTVQRTPSADFVPSGVVVPNRLVSNRDFDIKYQVRNQGPGIPYVNTWTDKIWLSPSKNGLDDKAVCMASFTHTGKFVADVQGGSTQIPYSNYHYEGDNYSVVKTIQTGNVPSGKYYVYVQVDATDAVEESAEGEANNIVCSDSVLFVEPDMIVTQFSISKDTLVSGDQVALVWTLENRGEADLQNGHSSDNLYATINQDGSGAFLVTTLLNDITIPAGGTKTLRANVTIPQMEQLDGIRYLFLDINQNHTIKESNTTNNRSDLVKRFCVFTKEEKVPTVAGPAIAVTDINTPAEIQSGSTGTIIFRISNVGDKRIEREVEKDIYLSLSNTFNIGESMLLQTTSIEGSTMGLRPGASAMITLRFQIPVDVLGGNYYFHILCDRNNTIHSKTTARNNAIRPVWIQGKMPDPVIVNAVVPDTIYTSQPDAIHFAWRNIGTWKNAPFDTKVYLSKSVSYNPYDKTNILLSTLTCPELLPSKEQVFKQSVIIEDKLAGKWYLHIVPTWKNRVFLSDSAKTYSEGVVVELSAVPDLIVSSIQTPSTWIVGETVQIEYAVQNNSDIKTRQLRWADDFWLSPSSKLDTKNAVKLGARTHSGDLEPEQIYEASVSYSVPTDMQGNYMLYVRTDVGNAVMESDEDNNYKAIPVFIQSAKEHPADLVITNLSVPDIVYAGEPVSITYTVTNRGEFSAEGDLRDIFYLSQDALWNTQDNMVGVVSETVRLAPGESISRTATGIISNSTAGDYYLVTRTNSTRAIIETNYENNMASASAPLRLDFKTLEIGAEMTVNTTALMKLMVQESNNQSIVIHLSHPMEAMAGLYVTQGAVPSTSRNGWHSAKLQTKQQEVVLSNITPGIYYVLAQDNGASMLSDEYAFTLSEWKRPQGAAMTLKAEIVNFGATSLDLTQGGNGGWVTTNINGALFDSIMDFRLVSGSRTMPAEVVTWNGETQSAVTFNLNEAEEGTYALISELPNGLQGTLENAFEVVEGRAFDLGLKLDFPAALRAGTQYFPFTFSYANGGTTDVELSEIKIVVNEGFIGLTVEELIANPQPTVSYKPHSETNSRGYVTIPPGEQGIVNVYCTPPSIGVVTVAIYILK